MTCDRCAATHPPKLCDECFRDAQVEARTILRVTAWHRRMADENHSEARRWLIEGDEPDMCQNYTNSAAVHLQAAFALERGDWKEK